MLITLKTQVRKLGTKSQQSSDVPENWVGKKKQ